MAYDSISTAELAPDKPITSELLNKFMNRDDFLNASVGTLSADGLQNKNFEIDSDSDGLPDGWTVTFYANGTGALDTSTSQSGKQSFKFTDPGGAGNGGGYIRSELVPVSTGRKYGWHWKLKGSATGIGYHNRIRYYDRNEVFTTQSTLAAGNIATTAWSENNGQDSPPTGAAYAQFELAGGTTNTTVAGNVWYDATDFRLAAKQPDLNVSTNVISGVVTTSTWVTVELGQYTFECGFNVNYISPALRGAVYMIPTAATSLGAPPPTGRRDIINTDVTNPSSYVIHTQAFTASKGFKGAIFTDNNGNPKAIYTYSDAPPDYEKNWNNMAKLNNWSWVETTQKNT